MFLEREKTLTSCLLQAPYLGSNLPPELVNQTGDLQVHGITLNHWATPAGPRWHLKVGKNHLEWRSSVLHREPYPQDECVKVLTVVWLPHFLLLSFLFTALQHDGFLTNSNPWNIAHLRAQRPLYSLSPPHKTLLTWLTPSFVSASENIWNSLSKEHIFSPYSL